MWWIWKDMCVYSVSHLGQSYDLILYIILTWLLFQSQFLNSTRSLYLGQHHGKVKRARSLEQSPLVWILTYNFLTIEKLFKLLDLF